VKLITTFVRWHLLPEPYLYGLADVGFTADFSHTYLFGKVYPHGQWFYFPAAFVIKSTLALLILMLLVPVAIVAWRMNRGRELLFLVIPATIYFAVVLTSGMNIGVRHILPVYPFLMALAGWAAAKLIERRRQLAYVVALILIFDVISSVRAFPVYLAYSNELWGGPSQTYKYLSDSNVDWGQQLKATKKYLDGRSAGLPTSPRWLPIPPTMAFRASHSPLSRRSGCNLRSTSPRALTAQCSSARECFRDMSLDPAR
jgi:hypothetical protein